MATDPLTQAELGNRLASARIKSGYTQEQVAEALHVPRTAVTHIENGHRHITGLELVQLGRLYGVEVRDLVEGSDPNSELLALFRRAGDGDQAEIERAIRSVLPLCRLTSELQDLLETRDPTFLSGQIRPYPPSALVGSQRDQGTQLARLERSRLGLGAEPISDLSLLAMRQGLIVAEHDLPDGVSGVYLNIKRGRSFILLQSEDVHGRKRFSLAHEYCHAIADSHERLIVSRYNDNVSRELRANAFASAFLLPLEGILRFASESGLTPNEMGFTDVAKLSVSYGLSYEATVVALESTGLVSPGNAATLHQLNPKAQAFIRRDLHFREPQFNRTTLREWAFQTMTRALELSLISVRKAVKTAKQLGYDEDVVRQNLSYLARETTL
jgi:Zn-dependent peptidase ImmA (M78 family)/transcriptional regulator with XRE-family HTH domain